MIVNSASSSIDGFPRALEQVEATDALLRETGESVSQVIEFNVYGSILEERIRGRWMHKSSGRSDHVKINLPKSPARRATGTTRPGVP